MLYKKFGDKYIVRLEIGEEVLESIEKLCISENIKLGRITGIGATNDAEVGMYRTFKKEYKKTELKGDMEILSLNGNISEKDGKVYLHIHTVLEDEKHEIHGGHLNKAVISATAEIIIDVIDGNLGRVYDDRSGLNLLDIK